uniref:DNA-directed RNA polymerase subunit beta n=1 Tax=Marseillevirus LCMAC201 TaxID=2506605 RepID=A0A481YWI4_9VIRU|nr:MAG: DNA-directed RNA polymerase subunit beta [Marseillevirus LCMAC201]
MNADAFQRLTSEYQNQKPWWKVSKAYFDHHTFTEHQLDSYNKFIREKLPVIITGTEFEYSKDGSNYVVSFENVYVKKPEFTEPSGVTRKLKPQDCRIRNLNYTCRIYTDITRYVLEEEKITESQTFPDVFIGAIPCMVLSDYCNLSTKDTQGKIKNGECPHDPGGYFIINGSEKVLMSQDRMAHNEIFVFKSKVKDTIKVPIPGTDKNISLPCAWFAEVRSHSSTCEPNISTTYLKFSQKQLSKGEEHRLYAELPGMKAPVPWPIIFMALGVTNKEDMISYVCSPDDIPMLALLLPSLDCHPIETQEDALNYLTEYVYTTQKDQRLPMLKRILREKMFQNVSQTHMKRFYFGHMTNQLLSTTLGRRKEDDRDHCGKKRVEIAGNLINNLFKSIWKRIIREVSNNLIKKRTSDLAQIFFGKITNYIKPPFATGNWIATKSSSKSCKAGISQLLNRHNYVSTLSNLRRVITPSDKNSKIIKPRHLHNSQWYFLCPAETPEGQPTGLIKNLSMLTTVSLGSSEDQIIDWLEMLNIVNLMSVSEINIYKDQSTKIFINGSWIAVTELPVELVAKLRELRREGKIDFEVSISLTKDGIRIYTDDGRLLAPFFIVEDGQLKSLPESFTWNELIEAGVIEYLDPTELETIKHSEYPWELSSEDTHALIHPCFLLGVSASIIPFPDHNQSPRNIYQCLWEDEPVLMSNGVKKPIKNVCVGDEIVTFDPCTFRTMSTTVTHAYTAPTSKNMLQVKTISGHTIVVTEDHKMMTQRGWVKAGQLQNTDTLAIYTGTIVFVPLGGITETANVRIGDITTASKNHCFIGGNGFCVHNSSMGKQALGIYSLDFLQRYDTCAHILCYPQKPLVNTNPMRLMCTDELPSGQNLIVAVMSAAYNQEDSVIINQRAVDNGALRSINYTTYSESCRRKGNTIDEIKRPEKIFVKETRLQGYTKLDSDGVSRENTPLAKRDVVIGKVNSSTDLVRDISVVVKSNGMEENAVVETAKKIVSELKTDDDHRVYEVYEVYDGSAVVDKVVLTLNEDSYRTVKVRVRQMRIPQIGDKVASRAAQKGIIGLILQPENMPFSEKTGMTPDLLMNPNAFPSRMTMGQALETFLGKACALNGAYGDCTPFEPEFKTGIVASELSRYGFEEYGDEVMINGMTGERIPCKIFMGPTYYQRLKHMVDDKIHARNQDGPRETLTRQPVEGRKRGGGFRMGEMETWCGISHGASSFLIDRLVNNSDGYEMFVCNYCGNTAIATLKTQRFECKRCQQNTAISKIRIPYAFKLLLQELQACCIGVWFNVDTKKTLIEAPTPLH